MTFECKDLDRALEVPELLREAREHARTCTACSRELWLWSEMSQVASALRDEWETPELWPAIQARLAAEPKRKQPTKRRVWNWIAVAGMAAMLAIAVYVERPGAPPPQPATQASDFLTDQTLHELEQTESAYLKSIEKLSQIAQPELQTRNSALSAAYREKLNLLDTEIAELRASIAYNRFNTRLQLELATLYREKQETLKEIVHREQKH